MVLENIEKGEDLEEQKIGKDIQRGILKKYCLLLYKDSIYYIRNTDISKNKH